MKRFSILLIALATIFSIIGVSADSDQVRRLTLEEAKQMAIENNIKYQLQDSYISDAGDSYDEVIESNKRAAKYASQGFLGYFNSLINPEVLVENAGNKIKSERLKKEDIRRKSDYNVENAFLAIKKAQYSLEDANYDIVIKQKDYEIGKIKFELGLIKSSEFNALEKAYTDAVSAKNIAQNKLYEELQGLNRLIGREITDYNIEPVITLNIIDISTIDLDKIRKEYIENDTTLQGLELAVDSARRKYDLTKEQYEKFVEKLKVQNSREDMQKAYDNAIRDYDNARSSFEDATKDLDITLNTTYNSLMATDVTIKNLIRDIEDAKIDLKNLKISYDLGLVSKVDYENAEIRLKTMQNKMKSSIVDMNKLYIGLMLYVD